MRIRIEGETRDLKFVSNTIRSHRIDGVVVQPVGIYIGPKADAIIADQKPVPGRRAEGDRR